MKDIGVLEEIVLEGILSIRTAFVGKLIRVWDDTADVQPLQMFGQPDGTFEKNPVLLSVPILKNVCKFETEEIKDSAGNTHEQVKIIKAKVGDVVLCICTDRDLGYTTEGKFDKPTRHHSISDAVIVGLF